MRTDQDHTGSVQEALNQIPSAQKFGDLGTADHEILSDEVNRAIITGSQ